MPAQLSISEIKSNFPNEWVLVGNPVMDEADVHVLSGIPLYHSKDKKEVCYLGREKIVAGQYFTLIYTGEFEFKRKITSVFSRKNL
jgi:hypothetical protein